MALPTDTFEPDLIVTSADSTEVVLVVEAKLRIGDMSSTERQLKAYMTGMQCPLGILITPQRLRVYHDSYTSFSEESIALVGDVTVSGVLACDPGERKPPSGPRAALEFERSVQAWLAGLTDNNKVQSLPPEVGAVVQQYLAPALAQGEVRAAGPRKREF